MAQNILETLLQKKKNLKTLVEKATVFGWIDAKRQKEIVENIENDVLTIGVIGQIKCGKSTFLNAFVFEDDVLPAATEPMTAALSVITYGEKKKIVAEFYSRNEWEELKLQASRSLEEVKGNEESKIKAAQDLVKQSATLGSTLGNYLGKTKEDGFENLHEYVGVGGTYVAITKSVKIYYPKEYLKGVEIVDTPGFNDPIVSREERTKEFLEKADVVLMMLYAGRPFDAIDKDILFRQVRQCGIGKVIIGINKYDIQYERGDKIEEIVKYVKEEIKKASKELDDEILNDLLKETEPIPLSAEMALLSLLDMSKITGNDIYQHRWKRHCNIFEISNQQQMQKKSLVGDLISAVKQLIEKEKEQILFAKPLNTILAAGNTKKAEIEKSIFDTENSIAILNTPNDELEEKLEKLNKAERRLNKKIDTLGDDLDSDFRQIVRKGGEELEDDVDAACKKMKSIVESKGVFTDVEKIHNKLNDEIQKLITRTLKRNVDSLSDDAVNKLKRSINDFFINAEEIIRRNLPDIDSRDFIKSLENKIFIDIDKDMFSINNSNEPSFWDKFWDVVNQVNFVGRIFAGAIFHRTEKRELEEFINGLRNGFDPKPFLESITKHKESIIRKVKDAFLTDLINPLQKQIKDIQTETAGKESKLKEAEKSLTAYKEDKKNLDNQIEEINQLKNQLNIFS